MQKSNVSLDMQSIPFKIAKIFFKKFYLLILLFLLTDT